MNNSWQNQNNVRNDNSNFSSHNPVIRPSKQIYFNVAIGMIIIILFLFVVGMGIDLLVSNVGNRSVKKSFTNLQVKDVSITNYYNKGDNLNNNYSILPENINNSEEVHPIRTPIDVNPFFCGPGTGFVGIKKVNISLSYYLGTSRNNKMTHQYKYLFLFVYDENESTFMNSFWFAGKHYK